MDIVLVIDGSELRGTLEDSASSRDLTSLLPVTLALADFHDTEKIGDLPRRLSTDDTAAAITPLAGDITYYAPWGNLALFYRDGPHSDGLVLLGRLDAGAADVLAGLDEGTAVTLRTDS